MKWRMLALISFGFIAMTVNWFNIAAVFGPIADEFGLSVPSVALLISVFVAAYGLLHIPGGFLATRWGLRRVLALGLAVEGAGALLSATAQSLPQMIVWRALCGAGASVFAAVGIAAVSVWFRKRHHTLALGVSSAAFSVGTALGLYVWADIGSATSWRMSLITGGALALAAALACGLFFRVPAGIDALEGVRLSRAGLRRTLADREIWLYGIAFFGAYGAYLTGSQLIAGYGEDRGLSGATVGAAALLIGIAGVPGSITAGWLAEKVRNTRALFVAGAVLESLFLLALPLTGPATFWIAALGIGFMFNFTFAVWQTAPGDSTRIAPEHLGTAVGLMLTVSAVGGFVLPWVFGLLVDGPGYPVAWTVMGVTGIATALVALAVRKPADQTGAAHAPAQELAPAAKSG
ncbi:MFS transporter [Streptomyces sp. DT24]|uniref:MFS transporter n=1 Tax=unclassified Streptomyces TaxID=2593676 RepID=UPI0023B908A5|nr:MFS transporter [Streptomyces sp. AM 4-1-1]WEH37031.1 MFS transporter [Streptomyces sp. AM 4-1-1]